MNKPYERERHIALEAVHRAGQVCRSVQAAITPDVLEKQDRSPVTVADFASQAIICRALGAAFPGDPLIDEEDSAELRRPENAPFLDRIREELAQIGLEATGDEICGWIDHNSTHRYSDRFWTLDPIDGTKGFLRGDQYAISLALIVEGQIDVALLGCPNLPRDPSGEGPVGALFYAVRGQGSWMLPLDDESTDSAASPVRVSMTDDPAQARFCEPVESGHSPHRRSAEVARRLEISRQPYRLDSQAKYAVVARGEADIYLRLPTRSGYFQKIWDHAGGVLLVEEAGGRVTDVAGRPLDWTHGHELIANQGVIVTNGRLHDQVLAALQEIGTRTQ